MKPWVLFWATIALTAIAGVAHYVFGDTAGTFVSAIPLVLVAPIIAIATDSLRGRLPISVVGIVQSGFGNVAELALTVVALKDNLPNVVRIAIAGSLLGNAILLGGIIGVLPTLRERGRMVSLKFDRQLFSGIATLSVIAVVPIALLSFRTGGDLTRSDRQTVSLAAGIALLIAGVVFILAELRRPHAPEDDALPANALPLRMAYLFLAVGGIVAALTSDWFVAGFEPAVERIGMPTAFAALVIIPLLGNVAENYVALRYAWAGHGDAAMAVVMHSVVQIALLMTGLLLLISRFVGSSPLTLQFDPVIALALVLSLVVLWMIVHDGEIDAVEAVGLLVTYAILGATVWTEGSL